MTNTYEEFLNNETALGFETANKIYLQILAGKEKKDGGYEELLDTLIKRAYDYGIIRSRWHFLSLQECLEIDEYRTQCHDLFIAAKNKLSKYMYMHGMGNDWDDLLGEERKRIGDFACFLCYVHALNAR